MREEWEKKRNREKKRIKVRLLSTPNFLFIFVV